MKTQNSPTLPSLASTDDKIALIRKLARLDEKSVRSRSADFPTSLFKESPVGRGYNIFGAFANNESVHAAVLDFPRLKQDGMVSGTPINDSDTVVVSGNTMEQLSESMSASVSASASGGFAGTSFSGSMSASFAKDTMFRHEYSYATLYQLHRVARVKLFPDLDLLRESYLTPQAERAINSDMPPESVIDFFGTHVLFDAVYGARFEYSSATNTWAYEAKTSAAAAIEASFSSINGSGSGSSEFESSEEEKSYASHSRTQVKAAGGDSEFASSLGSLEAWQATIDDNDPVLVQFLGDEPLVPIWKFARDEARQSELRAAVEDIARQIGAIATGARDLVIESQVKVLDASDEGGGNLELFGTIEVSILDGKKQVVWSDKPFSVLQSGPYVVLKKNGVRVLGTKTARIEEGEDPSQYTLRLRTQLTERDPGSSGDDSLGTQVVDLKFVEGRLLGDHVFRSKGNIVEFKFSVSTQAPS